jgi:transposase
MIKTAFSGAVLGLLDRLVLKDERWDRISGLIIGRPDQRGSTGRYNRMFMEGVLWIVRTGAPWRDLPEVFGEWNSVFRRFSRWSQKGVWQRIFEALSDDPDFEYLIIDSTIVRAHQHASGAKGGSRPGYRTLARRPEHQDPRIKSGAGRQGDPGSIVLTGTTAPAPGCRARRIPANVPSRPWPRALHAAA